jgi:hypothetical protein
MFYFEEEKVAVKIGEWGGCHTVEFMLSTLVNNNAYCSSFEPYEKLLQTKENREKDR